MLGRHLVLATLIGLTLIGLVIVSVVFLTLIAPHRSPATLLSGYYVPTRALILRGLNIKVPRDVRCD